MKCSHWFLYALRIRWKIYGYGNIRDSGLGQFYGTGNYGSLVHYGIRAGMRGFYHGPSLEYTKPMALGTLVPKAIGFVYSPLWKITVFGGRLFRGGRLLRQIRWLRTTIEIFLSMTLWFNLWIHSAKKKTLSVVRHRVSRARWHLINPIIIGSSS